MVGIYSLYDIIHFLTSSVPTDTLRTHIKGVITRHPGWEPVLAEFQVEGALMTSDWDAVQQLVSRTQEQTPELTLARLALAIREQDANHLSEALAVARTNLGAPITAAGPRSYRRSYDSVLNLHFVHELEMISHATLKISGLERAGQHTAAKQNTDRLTRTLSARLESTLPTFRTREPLLSMRRIAFSMRYVIA
jgi:serine/threonine-protein kinase ATR